MPAYKSGDVVSIRPAGFEPASARTEALFRDNGLEITRIVLRSGDHHAAYTSAGPVLLQCIDGHVRVAVDDTSRELRMGDLLYLQEGVQHSLSGVRDSAVLFVGMHSLPTPSDVPDPHPDAVEEASLESFPASDPPAIFMPGA
jgi:quercetin dioxygenase-like cupin family protein